MADVLVKTFGPRPTPPVWLTAIFVRECDVWRPLMSGAGTTEQEAEVDCASRAEALRAGLSRGIAELNRRVVRRQASACERAGVEPDTADVGDVEAQASATGEAHPVGDNR